MRIRHSLVLLALALPVGALADTVPADCAALTGALQAIDGYTLTAPPAGNQDGWCVLDQASFRSATPDHPDLTVERLRLRGAVADGVPVSLEVDLTGLRVRPKAGNQALDDRLRTLVLLQSADLTLVVQADSATELVRIDTLRLRLSGGTEVLLSAEVAGAGLGPGALSGGSLTALTLGWRNDGRLLRPLMAMAGDRLSPGLPEAEAIDATRDAMTAIVAVLPETLFEDKGRDTLERVIAAMPQGRGRLQLALTVEDGIGAGQLVMAGLKDRPFGPEALGQLLQGARLGIVWTPGLTP